MATKFHIQLKDLHDKTGLSSLAVAKKINKASPTTVRRYTSQNLITDRIETIVVDLAKFYGVDWMSVVEVVEVEE